MIRMFKIVFIEYMWISKTNLVFSFHTCKSFSKYFKNIYRIFFKTNVKSTGNFTKTPWKNGLRPVIKIRIMTAQYWWQVLRMEILRLPVRGIYFFWNSDHDKMKMEERRKSWNKKTGYAAGYFCSVKSVGCNDIPVMAGNRFEIPENIFND